MLLNVPVPEEDNILCGARSVAEEMSKGRESFLFVHQAAWQRELLSLYGNELCLLDATYRTSQYALPVFFLVVPTNVKYMVVATFITESEDTASIAAALRIIREWNPNWKPRHFMTDFSESEISAIESTFKGISLIYIDYFL